MRVQPTTAELLELTGKMLEHARAGEWDAITQLDQQRRPLLEALFADATDIPESARAELERLQTMDREIMTLAAGVREQLQSDLGGLQAGRKMQRAYAANR